MKGPSREQCVAVFVYTLGNMCNVESLILSFAGDFSWLWVAGSGLLRAKSTERPHNGERRGYQEKGGRKPAKKTQFN